MTRTPPEYTICHHCHYEIVRDGRTRSGWRHVGGGCECQTTYAIPQSFYRKQTP